MTNTDKLAAADYIIKQAWMQAARAGFAAAKPILGNLASYGAGAVRRGLGNTQLAAGKMLGKMNASLPYPGSINSPIGSSAILNLRKGLVSTSNNLLGRSVPNRNIGMQQMLSHPPSLRPPTPSTMMPPLPPPRPSYVPYSSSRYSYSPGPATYAPDFGRIG